MSNQSTDFYNSYSLELRSFFLLVVLQSGIGRGQLVKATLGSVEYIASLCKTEDESQKIKEAVSTSAYGNEFVHAALSVNEKVNFIEVL